MKAVHLRYLAFVLILLGLVLLGQATRKKVIWLKDGDGNQINSAAEISILADGKFQRISSPEKVPANLLSLAGVRLYPGDKVFADGRPIQPDQSMRLASTHSLQVRRAVPISLNEGPNIKEFFSTAATLGEALVEAGVKLHIADRLTPSPQTPLSAPVQATLHRSKPLTVHLQARRVHFRSAAQNVGEALAEAGLSVQGLDYSLPPEDAPLPADGIIRLVRVDEKVSVEQEPLAFETEMQPAQDLELDTRKTIQPGEYGLTARRLRTRYEDGREVSRAIETEWVAKQPQNRIVGYGTKIVVRTLSTPDGPVEYWRAVQMYATSYSPCRIYKDHCDSYTALGATLQKGIVAMTNDWCRYTCGDRVYVPGYGVGTVADTGGGIPGQYWIDLGYSEKDYVSWHQMVTVYFLAPVPSNFQWVLP